MKTINVNGKHVALVLVGILIFNLFYVYMLGSTFSNKNSKRNSKRNYERIQRQISSERKVQNIKYHQRHDFPVLNESWFSKHPQNGMTPDLGKYLNDAQKAQSKAIYKSRWRIADIDTFGILNRGMDVKAETKFVKDSDKTAFDDGWSAHAFNGFASDRIPVNRELQDPRIDDCKSTVHVEDLPDASIIFIFHNEAWSTLLRSVASVLNRSPIHLIREIVLVDDASELPHLQEPLEKYAAQTGKVRIIRAKERIGLIRARLLGASIAMGDVLIFLDSHIECCDGWLEPLLDRIARNRTTVVMPTIDTIIDQDISFTYFAPDSMQVGGFDWNLVFTWHGVPENETNQLKKRSDPSVSPTMAGGLFAIDREYFDYLGAYDDGMDIWGGENLEISFRIWMCGGRMEQLPCSHVGHIFRSRSPYPWRSGVDVLRKNNIRLAEVWMDELKEIYYDHTSHNKIDAGDISERVQLRKNLKCKSFKWYIDHVYPSIFQPWKSLARGEVRNKADPNMCLDAPKSSPATLLGCHGQAGNQFWIYTEQNEIRRQDMCLDSQGGKLQAGIISTYACHGSKGNQWWEYTAEDKILHKSHRLCLEKNDKNELILNDCKPGDKSQEWSFPRQNEAQINAPQPIKSH